MAASTYATIRLDTDLTGDLPTNEYTVLVENYQELHVPAVESERSSTGKLHTHRVLDGSDPLVFHDHHMRLYLTKSELTTLVGDLGKTCYYMPHYRDEGAGYASYRSIVLFEKLERIEPIDPFLNYLTADIYLRDDSEGSVKE